MLDLYKLKAFADNIVKVARMIWYFFDRVENNVGKGENADPAFSPFPTMFLTLSQTIPGFYMSSVEVFRKHCGKTKNCL